MAGRATDAIRENRVVRVMVGSAQLEGELHVATNAIGVVLFAHGSGSSRHSPRNQYVARALRERALGTLLVDLLTMKEEQVDAVNGHFRFDISLLADRLAGIIDWLRGEPTTQILPIGLFGASTGGGAALVAASVRPVEVKAVVSRGGRPDLAGPVLPSVKAPTLLIVGGDDAPVIELNRQAMAQMRTGQIGDRAARVTSLRGTGRAGAGGGTGWRLVRALPSGGTAPVAGPFILPPSIAAVSNLFLPCRAFDRRQISCRTPRGGLVVQLTHTLQDYRPIAEYALIGDAHSAALVATDGSIDWCCWPRFDSSAVFCRLVDARRGGYFRVGPVRRSEASRSYVGRTNLLATTFHTEGGRVRVTDCMPIEPRGIGDRETIAPSQEIIRLIEGLDGEVEFEVVLRPTFDFARRETTTTIVEAGVIASSGNERLWLRSPARLSVQPTGDVSGRFRAAGRRAAVGHARVRQRRRQ